MFPWLRLLRVGVTAIGGPRIGVLDMTRIRVRVWPNDLDSNLHVNNGRYLALADIGRLHWFLRAGVFELARRKRAFPIVGDALAKFRRDLKLFQAVDIETRMLGWNERWGFLEHRFIRNDRVLGVVTIRGVFKGPEGPLQPGVLLHELGVDPVSPPLPEYVTQWNQSCEALSQQLRQEEQQRGVSDRR